MEQAVNLLDLRGQFKPLRAEILSAIERLCDAQTFILGKEVEDFEREIATYLNAPYALGVSSGTDALLLSLMAEDIGPGDEVIIPPFTFFATAGSVARVGAKPIFVDIDPEDFNLDPNLLEAHITPRTKALMPVHLYGQCADMAPMMAIARKHKLVVLEDVAQAIGAGIKGQQAGNFGDYGCFSFFPSKNLGCFGDGGLITAQDEARYKKLKSLRMHGETQRYHHKYIGGNFRIDALQAAVLRIKLPHLKSWEEGRRKNAARYRQLFAETGLIERELVKLPEEFSGRRHVFNQFVLRVQNRDGLMEHLKQKNIGCNIYYPIPLHLQECFQYLGYREGQFPHSERAAEETIAIPIFPELNDSELQTVVGRIAEFYR